MVRVKMRYQDLMRFKTYQTAERIDPRTGKIPQKKVELSCHYGRWVNPRDRAIFPQLQTPEHGKRDTYDQIDPAKLKFPSPWKWDAKNTLGKKF